jgi:ParB-like chromosome segregation protein Spo0J
MIKLSTIRPNPANPRTIKDAAFEKLCRSIEQFPAMMELRPIVTDSEGMILGGNMRFKALSHLGYKEVPETWVKRANELTEDEKRRFIVSDNAGFGDWDLEELAANWSKEELEEWGVEVEWGVGDLSLDDLSLKDNAFADAANALSFSITFNFPISEKEAFSAFDKKELEKVLKDFVYA